ncbi:pleckstrin homology domain-containing family O member 2 [Salarias fasciatus]|uniref:PH domain-containing protein n=1 Tax=Salarias fasciatus TaxID=181472 RepID=A0A672GPB1_SALFA|nr:pleckstrin homology domain-containing family O member 2 [Salarias fasciatus]
MEEGAKEEPAQKKEPKFLGKAGMLKKASGRLLASYKDRYVQVERTEVALYENEDLQNCLERFDLESYDRCHDLKSPFKKKHRLILIRSPKSGNKVHDVKFQAQSAEDKEAWIKALSDGINRAKNKVFDEVKVDESSNLEHVTRTRPKANRNRRPPTRIHMKEVAGVSSDGILRLDLDLEDAVMPNGTHHAAVDGTHVTPRYNSGGAAETAEDKPGPDPEEKSQKKIIKPPMPPTKEAKASPASQDEHEKDVPEKKVLKPPMPPVKEAKPCASPVQEKTEETKSEQLPEKSPEAIKKSDKPPTPPNKPSSLSSSSSLPEASQARVNSPPTPPSKQKKPCHQTVESDPEVQSSEQENKEKGEADGVETVVEKQGEDEPFTEEEPSQVIDGKPESPCTDGEDSEEDLQKTVSGINTESNNDPEIATEPLRKSPSPLLTSETRPDTPEICAPATQDAQRPDLSASDTSTSSLQAEDSMPESEVPSIIVSLNESLTDSLGLSPRLCRSSEDKSQKSEEKSVDSGQHSDEESECSGCEDTLAASTSALRGSHVGLDVLDNSEDDIQTSVPLIQKPTLNKPPIKPKIFAYHCLESAAPLKPSTKAKSASSGDLLSSAAVCAQVKQPQRAGSESMDGSLDKVVKLEGEVALEMENTSELLNRVSGPKTGTDGEEVPEDLLAKAMEKLKKADHVLREVNKLKLKHSSHDRKSW